MLRKLGKLETLMHHIDVNIVVRVSLSSEVDVKRLVEAFNNVLDYHALANVNIADKGWFIKSASRYKPEFIKTERLDDIINKELCFSFANDHNLIRATIVKGELQLALLLTFHHVIADAGSISYFCDHLFSLYQGRGVSCDYLTFPSKVDDYLQLDNIELKPGEKFSCKNKFKRFESLQIKNFQSKNLLNYFDVNTMSCAISACIVQVLHEIFDIKIFTKLDNIDLRNYLLIENNQLAIYSTSVCSDYGYTVDTKFLAHQFEEGLIRYFQELGLTKSTSCLPGINKFNLAISYIDNRCLAKLSNYLDILDLQFYGSAFNYDAGQRLLFLINPFSGNFNITVCYDVRNVSDIKTKQVLKLLKKELKKFSSVGFD